MTRVLAVDKNTHTTYMSSSTSFSSSDEDSMSCDNDHDSEDEVSSEKGTESVVDEFQAVQKKLLSLSFNPGKKDQLWLTHMWFQEENHKGNLEIWEQNFPDRGLRNKTV